MSLFTKKKSIESTKFATFIREADSGTKKKVYTSVLKRAVERQAAVVDGKAARK